MSQKTKTRFKESEKQILQEIADLRSMLADMDQKLEHLIGSFHQDRFTLSSSNSTLDEFMSESS